MIPKLLVSVTASFSFVTGNFIHKVIKNTIVKTFYNKLFIHSVYYGVMIMTFRLFVIKNVIRNKRSYVDYFLRSMFTVMVFFTFAIFAFHPAFGGGDINSKPLFGM